MNDTFYHKQITTKQMEDFIIGFTGISLEPIFNQYLRSTKVPKLQWKQNGTKLQYRFVNAVDGFELPVPFDINHKLETLKVTSDWQVYQLSESKAKIKLPPTFLITEEKLP